jgi:hypothetical protein
MRDRGDIVFVAKLQVVKIISQLRNVDLIFALGKAGNAIAMAFEGIA